VTGVGLCLPQLGEHASIDAVRGFAQRAEELGYTSLWVQEHFMWPLQLERGFGGTPGRPMPDPYKSVLAPTELLAAVAAWTSTPKLGTSILVAGYHWPVPLAQRLATLDAISDGRLIVGLGIGWNAEEHAAAGTDITTRGRRMDDFLPALLACWGDDPVRYDGPIFQIPDALVRPKPVQRPRPQILSGMWSEAGRARTTREFDGWNPAGLPAAAVAEMAAAMNADRPDGMGPLSIFLRLFAQFPGAPEPAADPIGDMAAEARIAAESGMDEVIIEASYWNVVRSPADWLEMPDRCLPVLEAAQSV
jgi:probable F420-dependent oxidoreductase